MLVFRTKYFIAAALLFLIEIIIALFWKDSFVRPFLGDVLVVILIYFFLRIFLNVSYLKIAIGVLAFACCIEVLQYFDFVKMMGLESNPILSVALGRTFEWKDFGAYLIGFILILAGENLLNKNNL